MKRILISNDDGLWSEGIRALTAAVEPFAQVWVVAPDRERSAQSHAITLHSPLRITQHGERRFAIDGTPADCVYIAIHHIMKEFRPDLVISGINHGPNLSDDIHYSGTVAAAREGVLWGIAGVAFSYCGKSPRDFSKAAEFAARLIPTVLQKELPKDFLLNVNIPENSDGKTWILTRQGDRSYHPRVEERFDFQNRAYYWSGGIEQTAPHEPQTDAHVAYNQGMISVTPLRVDVTHEETRKTMESWSLQGAIRTE